MVIDDIRVSWHHAILHPEAGRWTIEDEESTNGASLNGQPVTRGPVGPGDIVGIGHSAFCLVGDALQKFVDTGEVSLDVQGLGVTVGRAGKGGRTRRQDPAGPGLLPGRGEKCLLGVVGPSGAGKSTLLNALTGRRPADSGTELDDGRDLYRDFAELRRRTGLVLVPQDDILHAQLTVRKALDYAAELRFPQDNAKAERRERVAEVIRELGLGERADQPIHSLSGGQRRRVSVTLELLTKPSLLFLDEPTSGLAPGRDRSVMNMLRGPADDGRTVIVVTRSGLSLEVRDRLLVHPRPRRARSRPRSRPDPTPRSRGTPRRGRPRKRLPRSAEETGVRGARIGFAGPASAHGVGAALRRGLLPPRTRAHSGGRRRRVEGTEGDQQEADVVQVDGVGQQVDR